jgi:hypothetical protein
VGCAGNGWRSLACLMRWCCDGCAVALTSRAAFSQILATLLYAFCADGVRKRECSGNFCISYAGPLALDDRIGKRAVGPRADSRPANRRPADGRPANRRPADGRPADGKVGGEKDGGTKVSGE